MGCWECQVNLSCSSQIGWVHLGYLGLRRATLWDSDCCSPGLPRQQKWPLPPLLSLCSVASASLGRQLLQTSSHLAGAWYCELEVQISNLIPVWLPPSSKGYEMDVMNGWSFRNCIFLISIYNTAFYFRVTCKILKNLMLIYTVWNISKFLICS